MLEFILARYNYWIVIVLMMTGLYIVFSRGNLVKTLIGLNLFQTSVFIFYITVGKVQGGTAPILIEDKNKKKHDDHGGHDAGHHGDGHGAAATAHTDAPADMVGPASEELISEAGEAVGDTDVSAHLDTPDILPEATNIYSGEGAADAAAALPTDVVLPQLYSNPLPHVLILTAIVVGVATTSVGLALAVRIREAYGTVEQDQLEAIDQEEETAEALV